MSKSSKDTARVSLSPATGGVKRERSEDEEESTRRAVSPRTQERTMVQLLTEDLRVYDEAVLEKGLKDLYGIINATVTDAKKHVEKQAKFLQFGGHVAVVTVMNQHPNSHVIQMYGIRVIANIAYTERNRDGKELRTAIGKVKGIQAVLAAMKKFESDRPTVRNGFAALVNSASNHEDNCRLLVTKLEAAPFLTELMIEFSDDEDIVKTACLFFRALSRFQNLRDSLLSAEAATALATAYDGAHANSFIKGIAKEGLNLLTRP